MKSLNHSYIAELDQLRGAAALLVFFYHSVHRGLVQVGSPDWPIASNPLSALVLEGHTGVALFMVLSGFVLARGTFGKDIIYREFIRNRVLRIFPLMIIVIMIAIASVPKLDIGQITAWFLLMGNTSAAIHDKAEMIGALWTVAVEFQFYLVAPFIFTLTGKQGIWRFLLPLALFFIAMRLTAIVGSPNDLSDHYRLSYFTIAGRINQFLIGIGLAYLYEKKLQHLSRSASFSILTSATIAVLSFLFLLNRQGGITSWHPWHAILPEVEALTWAAFLLGYISAKPLGRFGEPLARVGIISYGLYVLHYAIQLNWWVYVFPRTGIAVHSSLELYLISFGVLILALIMAAISWKCIEEPFDEMRRSYLKTPVTTPEGISMDLRKIQPRSARSEVREPI